MAWEALPVAIRARLIARGEAVLKAGYPPLPASAYMDFKRNGNRTRFEAAYMARRRTLNAAVMAECADYQGRFLDTVINGIFALCEETGWQLPAHNTLVRDTPTTILPDIDTPVLDLFACETGAQLALIDHLLGPELDAVSPLIRARLRREINTRVIEPYLSRHFWWMGNGDEPMCNWTAWCTQNILLTVMSGDYDVELRRQFIFKAAGSLDAFLKDYGDDGACEEGAQYYRHAGLCLFTATDILTTVTDGAFSKLFSNPKISNIADYILNIHIRDQTYFNFADCSPFAGRSGVREFLFGRAVGSTALADFAAHDWAASDMDCDLPDEINLYYRLQAAFEAQAIASAAPANLPKRADIHYPSIGLFILRDPVFDLAVKAGDNGDSHGHADSGSVILYKHGKPLLIDIGVESYTAKTFSAARHEIWTIRSAYHNLPVFNGVEQGYGAAFGARAVSFAFADDESRVSMELAPAYPEQAGVRSARRTVRLIKGQEVSIEDVRDPAGPAVFHLIVAMEPVVAGSIIQLPGLARLTLTGAGTPSVETLTITDERLRTAWPDRLYRIAVPFSTQVGLTVV